MSTECVLVIACGALAHDLVSVKQLNQWTHLDIQCLPAELHNTPQLIPRAVQKKIQENRGRYRRIFAAYSDCGTGGLLDKILEQEGVERLPGAHCYEMFAGAGAFVKLNEAELGTFYLTDFLARHFKRLIIQGLGLDRFPQLKQEYFAHYKKVVYLTQRDDEELQTRAHRAAEYLELDYERVFTGQQHLATAMARVATADVATANEIVT